MGESKRLTESGCVNTLLFLAGLDRVIRGLGCTTLIVGCEDGITVDSGCLREEVL